MEYNTLDEHQQIPSLLQIQLLVTSLNDGW